MKKILLVMMILSLLSCNKKDDDDEAADSVEYGDYGSYEYLLGKTFSTSCFDIMEDGSIYVDLTLAVDDEGNATTDFMLYDSSDCDADSRVQRTQAAVTITAGTEGDDYLDDEELVNAFKIDSEQVYTHFTVYTADAATDYEEGECDGEGLDFSGNLGVPLDVTGKCLENDLGEIEYGIVLMDLTQDPPALVFGSEKDGDDHDGSTPELRQRNLIPIILYED